MYRYDEGRGKIQAGYPRDMQNWRVVPAHIDGAITWRDGKISALICATKLKYFLPGRTNFFKEDKYWTFDDQMVITDSQDPLDTSAQWFDC